MKDLVKKQWFGILSLLVGVAVSSYTYLSSKVEREPVFVVDPVRTLIANGNRAGIQAVNVTDKDGKAITGDVIAVRYTLWNEGRRAIKSVDVLEELRLIVEGKESGVRSCLLPFQKRERGRSCLLPSDEPPEAKRKKLQKATKS